jgi:hypothetical protein
MEEFIGSIGMGLRCEQTTGGDGLVESTQGTHDSIFQNEPVNEKDSVNGYHATQQLQRHEA